MHRSVNLSRLKMIAMHLTMPVVAFALGLYYAKESPDEDTRKSKSALTNVILNLTTDSIAKDKLEFQKAQLTPGRINRERALLDFAEKLDETSAKELLDDFAKQALTQENADALHDVAYRWAELDPEAALAWALGLHDKDVQGISISAIFEAYAAKDPAVALGVLAKLKGVAGLSSAEAGTMIDFALQDPKSALTALQSLPEDSPNKQALEGYTFVVFQYWAETDPAAAAAEALNLPDGGSQKMSWRSIGVAWAQQDPVAALAWANNLPPGASKDSTVYGAIQAIGETDPQSAAMYALNLSGGTELNNLMDVLTSSWAQIDPAELLTWADKNLNGLEYDTATLNALSQMSSSDPASVAAYLAQHADPNVSNKAIPTLAATWAQQDAQAALAWAQSLPNDNAAARNSAIVNVFTGWASTDPAATAAYVQQNFATDPSLGKVAAQVVNSWAKADPQAALQWAENLPPVKQNAAVVAAMSQLAKVDAQSAGEAAQNALNSMTSLTQAQQTALQKIAAKAASH